MFPVEKEIPNTLDALQEEVGGLIECVYLDDVVNEEGKLIGMEPNRRLGSNIEPYLIKIVSVFKFAVGVFKFCSFSFEKQSADTEFDICCFLPNYMLY